MAEEVAERWQQLCHALKHGTKLEAETARLRWMEAEQEYVNKEHEVCNSFEAFCDWASTMRVAYVTKVSPRLRAEEQMKRVKELYVEMVGTLRTRGTSMEVYEQLLPKYRDWMECRHKYLVLTES